MNATIATSSNLQMGFDFNLRAGSSPAVNKFGATSVDDLDLSNPSGIAAGEALSRMIVDDRVLYMGMTNWRELLDRAIGLGHTELYPSEDDRQGLRKPGMRFGPITRMPERGPEYVKRAVLAARLQIAHAQGLPLRSGRVPAGDANKVDWVLSKDTLCLTVYEGRKPVVSLELVYADLPVTNGGQDADAVAHREYLTGRLAELIPGGDCALFGKAATIAFAQALKILDGVK